MRAIEYGEHECGEKYADALEVTGLGYGDLRDIAWVHRAVPVSVRTDKLSWSHHKQVAKLDSDAHARLLTLAPEQGWTKDPSGKRSTAPGLTFRPHRQTPRAIG